MSLNLIEVLESARPVLWPLLFMVFLFLLNERNRRTYAKTGSEDQFIDFMTLLGLFFIILIIFGIYHLISKFIVLLADLDPTIGTAIFAVSGTIIVTLGGNTLSRYLETRATVLREHREKKSPVYEEFLHFMFRFLLPASSKKTPTTAESRKFLSEFSQKMMVWGGDDVLIAWGEFRTKSTKVNESGDSAELINEFENLVKRIRRDLGHKNRGMKPGDILRLFVNDLDDNLKS